MLNLNKIVAFVIIASFLASIPLTLAINNQLVPVTYTIEVDDYYAKPSGTPGGGKTSPGYALTGYKWKTLPLTVRVNPGDQDASFIYAAISASFAAWDAETAAELVESCEVSSSVFLDGPTVDRVNEVVFGSISDANIIAQCTYWYYRATREIVDFEIVFNTRYTWGDATVTGTLMDVQNIATHELGHGFGLADLYDAKWAEQTMYGYGAVGEIKKRSIESGDIAGIEKLYGA